MRSGFLTFFSSIVPDEASRLAVASLDGLVTAVSISPDGALRIDLLLEAPERSEALCIAEAAMEHAAGIPEVCISIHLPESLSGLAAAESACLLKDWALRRLRSTDAFLATLLGASTWTPTEEGVSLAIATVCHDSIRVADLAGRLRRFFQDHLGTSLEFVVVDPIDSQGDLGQYAEALCQSADLQANEAHRRNAAERDKLPKNSAGNTRNHGASSRDGKAAYRRRPQAEGVFWGRADSNIVSVPVVSLNSESGTVRVEGRILAVETRSISQNTKVLLTLSVTDYTSSISVKAFLKPEDADDVAERCVQGAFIGVYGNVFFDSQYAKDLQIRAEGLMEAKAPPDRCDSAPEKRVELHVHTKMSAMDAVCDVEALVATAAAFGHSAVAITDHGVVQAFPDAFNAFEKARTAGNPLKLIFGIEGYLVDDGDVALFGAEASTLDDGFVAVDVETTGLDASKDRLLEVGAVIFLPDGKGGFTPSERLSLMVDPGIPVPEESTRLTGITQEMVEGASTPEEALERLSDFMGARPMVAHNAFFDLDFLRYGGSRATRNLKMNPAVIDTLNLSQLLLKGLSNYKLPTVAAALGVSLERHHRATDDAEVCGGIFTALYALSGVKSLQELDEKVGRIPKERFLTKAVPVHHIILLVKDVVGLYGLYRLVSESHTRYFHYKPRIPRSLLRYFRTGLLVGAACEAGEIFTAVREAYESTGSSFAETLALVRGRPLVAKARFYDYLEVQPIGNNAFLLREKDAKLKEEEDLRQLNRLVLSLGDAARRPVCATSDAHYLQPRDAELRRILLTARDFPDAQLQPPLHFRTTAEMLDEFAYLGKERAFEVVVKNPVGIASRIADGLRPFPGGSYPPQIEGAAEEVQRLTEETALKLYGRDGVLPTPVRIRMERELTAVIKHGFAVMYYIAHKLVKKSNDDGYIVGSRGSVGSSVVATFLGISEVNPLPPHYLCPSCRMSEFDDSGAFGSGYDLPEKTCPVCGIPYGRDGQDIPFETFLGFNGDKQPDIDLNFSGDYQPRAHKYIEEMFGHTHTFRAGTISGYADKNAIAMVLGYYEKNGLSATNAEKTRLSEGLVGVKRTTGQHPGGIVVVPKEREIFDFTPVQRPADRSESGIVTTHFDFNALHETILKLDVLGHDDPTMLKMLGDMTGFDVRTLPLPDPDVMSLFVSTKALGISSDWPVTTVGTLGLPELGTHMARDMITETRPTRFFDLVQLMGLSHGRNVWKGNAQDLIRNGTCTINDVIGCRDSIMTWLIHRGLPPMSAFEIMEKVRRGKGLTEAQETMMREKKVPDWYINSCKKISYMFPKAHAAAYAISALRIGWFKVHRPLEYYASYFTVRADEFDASRMCRSEKEVRMDRESLRRRQRDRDETFTDRDEKIYYILEIVEEMFARGIEFLPLDLYNSDATRFLVEEGRIRPPLRSLPGLGENAARGIAEARAVGTFKSRDDLSRRAGVGSAILAVLADNRCLEALPHTSQLDLFGMM